MLTRTKLSSRDRIVRAAVELAHEVGPAHLSLDAVAARAGLSKGGLLYSFPTKARLLEAVVEEYMKDHEKAVDQQQKLQQGDKNRAARAFVDVYRLQADDAPPGCGVLAALMENPDFMIPVRHYRRALLDRMLDDATDTDVVLFTYLALTGLECSKLLDCEVLSEEECRSVICRLEKILEAG
ncbi:TetR/AcrR family transcriptional regulator [Falsochrobactrum shanghaiense]|uniref:TetR/AcrR family transcriptional regulator n=1 Tax=Falsochrobactrum shanghaiense TaxID=2201899 RepID=A0A316JB37_9HYPH|nr:TetR/AcrR family transcriptional regulator [Falsochrobactrum shanghaiense]PWL17875.1 TetR/AcrR family transcriptional regulator [Falsochrobactrum shanghaiense]